MNAYDTAEHAIENGFSILLIERGGKRPVHRFAGRPPMTHEELRRLYRKGMNIAIRLPGLAALDADDERGKERLHESAESPITQTTPHGGEHRVFRLPQGLILNSRQKLFGVGYDLKTGSNSYLMLSPSQVDGRRYVLRGDIVPPSELPEFNVDWIREEVRKQTSSLVHSEVLERPDMRRVYAYLDACPVAESGFAGHTTCFTVATNLLRKFKGLDKYSFWNALLYYNRTKCKPPFREDDENGLKHKWEDAWAAVRGGQS